MKKSDKMIFTVYIIIGIILIVCGLTIDVEYYSSMIFAMGVGLFCSSIVQLIRFYHNTKPENIEAYQEKVRKRSVDLKDERKNQIRNRAGYLTWGATMIVCFIASVIAALFRAGAVVVGAFAGAAVLQYIAATVIYKFLCKKM